MVSSVLGRLNFPFLISWVLLLSHTKTIEAFTNFKFEAKKLAKFFPRFTLSKSRPLSGAICARKSLLLDSLKSAVSASR